MEEIGLSYLLIRWEAHYARSQLMIKLVSLVVVHIFELILFLRIAPAICLGSLRKSKFRFDWMVVFVLSYFLLKLRGALACYERRIGFEVEL